MGTITNEARIDRRSFLTGAGLLASVGLAGMAWGCAPQAGSDSNSGNSATTDTAQTQTEPPAQIDETLDCDIVVVGAGGSGLAAVVQASELGASVVCIESQNGPGGNLNGVEGCFGIGSKMQTELGINVDPGATIRSELTASQFRASGLGYVDLVHASGENINWLIEQGVQFEGVDADKGDPAKGDPLVFHRFANRGTGDYVPPMVAKAEANGVEFRYQTKGEQLIVDNDVVAGVYASTSDGMTLQINAKSVIIATGGFADNAEYMAEMSIDVEQIHKGGYPGHDGDGHRMAVNAGAVSTLNSTALLAAFYVNGTPGYYENGVFAFLIGVAAPYSIWVNENGERYVNEDFTGANIMLMSLPYRQNKNNFIIMDQPMMDIYLNGSAEGQKQLEDGIAEGSIFVADSIDALAQAIGAEAATLANTVERYNGFAAAGSDQDFGKSPEVLMPLAQAPYYAINPILEINTTIGSIKTDRNFHALNSKDTPIEGLYVVGVEGAMLWSNVYTINVPGGCNANNVNSGRVAARDAVSKL
ncbi:MAG: FAD-dependent oxidoreductase [Coriobacteriales bacterium]|jgi:fumarate reductase flavoprotein subunit|nr:FAD-dependent oxidoreductase [Coriobacteriales bacterium]